MILILVDCRHHPTRLSFCKTVIKAVCATLKTTNLNTIGIGV